MEQVGWVPAWPAAKIAPPRSRTLVSRQRLLDPLNAAAAAGRVTLIVAPGGSGKTSLLVDWARQAPLPVAWYALDAADHDTRRLAQGLCAAVERVLPGVANQARAALDAGAPEAAAIGLLLGALDGRPLALVLDDFQHLDDQPDAVALWDHFLRFRPPTLALIILSRSVPLLGFAALAALDELVGLGRVDLRFDAGEAAELLCIHGLNTQAAAHLAARSGGWATGVLLLARAAPDGVRFLRARVEALMEHLGGEILAALPDDLRRFMVESAALGPASPALANAALGRENSALLYAEVSARGLFLDQEDELYRYHDLFAEYLIGVLKADDPERLRAIRREAAVWWGECGDLPRALALLAADEDWEMLAATLDREQGVLWSRGLWGTVLTHVDRLPREYRTPRLLALCGHVRWQRGEHVEALALADAGMAAATDDEEWLRPAHLRTQALVQIGRYDEGIRSAEAALTIAHRAGHHVAEARLRELRGIALLRTGCFEAGRSDLLAALSIHKAVNDEMGEALALFNLATQLVEAGCAHDAAEYLDRARTLWRRGGNSVMLGHAHNSRALLHMLTGDLLAACDEAKRAIVMAREVGDPLLECAATATLAEACADAGNAAEAENHARAATDLARRLDLTNAFNDALRATIAAALLRRDRAGARRAIDDARPHIVTPVDSALLDLYEGILALRSRAYHRAAAVLGEAAEHLEGVNRPHGAARAHLFHAEALLALGSVRRAEAALNRMAALVLPLGCDGYLHAAARLVRHVHTQYRLLRKLRRETRLVLERLAAGGPALAVLPPATDDSAAPPALLLSPFGNGRIALEGQEVEPSALPPKARELLFYAAHAGRPLARAELLEALWEGDVQSSQALWDASRHVRRVLGEESWRPRGGCYTLHMEMRDEGRCFDEAAAHALGDGPIVERLAAAEQALNLAGDGGYLEWCDSFWTLAERERVTRRIAAVALTAADLYGQLGRPRDAIAACRRAMDLDPLGEEPRMALLRCLAACGDVGGALREYGAYRRLLREELQTEPSAGLRALAQDLQARKLLADG